MSYALKYIVAFDSTASENYSLEILEKDYTGDFINVIASGVPVVQSWDKDEVKPAVKGCALEARLINKSNLFPLSALYSVEDDRFQVIFKHGSDVLFMGFLVQDDCSEVMTDTTHEVTIYATDNLGLLKDVSLSEAAANYGVHTLFPGCTIGWGSNGFYPITGGADIQQGDTVVLTNSPIDGTYTVTFISGTEVFTSPVTPFFVGTQSADIEVIRPVDLTEQLTEAKFIRLCLLSTGLSLNTRVFMNLAPQFTDNGRALEDILLEGSSFLRQGEYLNCYEVLEKILFKYRLTLLQAEGYWNLVRWDELRYYENEIPGFIYDEEMDYVSNTTLSSVFIAGRQEDTYPETGITKSIFRPYRYVKETFNYVQPEELLKNGNFSRLGNLLNGPYAFGDNFATEYEMADWGVGYEWTSGGGGYFPSSAQRFIRVIRNPQGDEVDRYGVIKGQPGFDSRSCAQSEPIEILAGETLKFTFQFRTSLQETGTRSFSHVIVTTVLFVPRGVNNRNPGQNSRWYYPFNTEGILPLNINLSPSGVDGYYNTYQTVEFEAIAPYNGHFYFKLGQFCISSPASTVETHYKNIRLEIFKNLGGTSKVIGHTHTATQDLNIKNKSEEEIFIDWSPSASNRGTMFYDSYDILIQDRAERWNRPAVSSIENKKLGEIITFDELFWRRIPRTKLEGTLFGLIQTRNISPLSVIQYTGLQGYYLFGKCEIDYRNNKVSGTLHEQWRAGEVNADLNSTYEFKYLYEKS